MRRTKKELIVKDVACPRCGAGEMHPADIGKPLSEQRLLIRGFKVSDAKGHWWSQCLVCAGYYDKALNETPKNFTRHQGWF